MCYAETGEVMEIINRLLQEGYCTYKQLRETHGALGAEALWQELKREREKSRILIGSHSSGDFLCLTPFVRKRQYELLLLLAHCELYYHSVQKEKQMILTAPVMQEAIRVHGLQYECPVLLREQLKRDVPDLLLVLFCFNLFPYPSNQHFCDLWKELILPGAELKRPGLRLDFQLWKEELLQQDKTYLFLRFLQQLELKFNECLLLLNRDRSDFLHMTKEQLLHRYPQVSNRQIEFFVSHRNIHDYYTISEYMKFNDVCYETARQAMEQLVEQQWYHRRKIGKRFFYSINR